MADIELTGADELNGGGRTIAVGDGDIEPGLFEPALIRRQENRRLIARRDPVETHRKLMRIIRRPDRRRREPHYGDRKDDGR